MIKHKRRIILRSISAAAVIPAVGIPLSSLAALQKIDPKDPQAAALGYTDDTNTVDKKKFPKHDRSQTCSNCQFYQTEQEVGNLAPCTIFAGKAVAAKGWCSAWVKKTAGASGSSGSAGTSGSTGSSGPSGAAGQSGAPKSPTPK